VAQGIEKTATAASPAPVAAPILSTRVRPKIRREWRNPIGLVGAAIVLITILMAVLAPIISPFSPSSQGGGRLVAPGPEHLMGTDELGRDVLSRVIYGSQASLQVGAVSVILALVVGVAIGVLAGFYRGWIDDWLMRLIDIVFAFPGLVLAIVIAGLLGPSRTNAMIAIGIVYAPAFARVIRGSVLAVMAESYVEAARVVGASDGRIMLRHLLPNIMAPIIVLTTVYLSTAILSEASLSFLGLGTQPPEPSWGGMLNAARRFMELAPWLAIFPGGAIMLVVLGFNFLGDGLRDILDPRIRTP
jgi:ABC-type dipeptide/oligopeptide/nickel transport system permease subunit